MLGLAVVAVVLLYAGWGYLLYRLHVALWRIDPAASDRIGKPSLFWTPFNGHALLVKLIRQRDLGSTPHAALAPLARVMRIWAVATILATAWLLWAYSQTPDA